jgi:hypothetical protein
MSTDLEGKVATAAPMELVGMMASIVATLGMIAEVVADRLPAAVE